jgi:hypothetical protein
MGDEVRVGRIQLSAITKGHEHIVFVVPILIRVHLGVILSFANGASSGHQIHPLHVFDKVGVGGTKLVARSALGENK